MAVQLKAVGVSHKRICGESVQILQQVHMSVPTGVIYGLLGPSGCGKTTLLRCIIGSIQPSNGTVSVFGKVPNTFGSGVPGPIVGYMPQDTALILELTINETLLYYGRVLLMEEKQLNQRITFLMKLLNLPDQNRTVKRLSGGQRRRVSLAVAIIHEPPLVILDEPTVGVDPMLRQSIWNHLFELSTEKGCTVIVTTHYTEEVSKTDIVGLMRNGRLLVQSTPKDLFENYNTNCIDDAFLQLCYSDNLAEAEEHGPPEQNDKTTFRYRKLSGEEDIIEFSFGRNPVYSNSIINWKRLSAATKKSMVLMKRSPILLGTLLIYPLGQLLLWYCIWSDGVHGIHMGIVNEDHGLLANKFLDKLDKYVITQRNYKSVKDAYNSVHEGNSWGVIHTRSNFSDHFTKRIEDGLGASDETLELSEITVNLVMTSPTVSQVLMGELHKSYQEFLKEHAIRLNSSVASLKSPILFGTPIYGESEPSLPSIAAIFLILSLIYMTSACLASLSIVMERELGAVARSRVAGLTTAEVILSNLIVQFIMILLLAAFLINFVIWVFHLHVKGSIALAVSLTILNGICGMVHGFFITVISTDVRGVIAGLIGTVFPMAMLSGFMWPVEGMPIWLQYVSNCTPMTIPHEAMKSIFNRGWGLSSFMVCLGFGVMFTWIIIFILLSFLTLHIQSKK